jgi:hypothetical protein
VVDIFNVSSGLWSTASLSVARSCLDATSVSNYALFGGGGDIRAHSNIVDMFLLPALPSPPPSTTSPETTPAAPATTSAPAATPPSTPSAL